MNSETHRFEYKNETHKIIGCSMEVLNELGRDLLEVGQMLNDLKSTGHKVGLIINFKKAKLE